MFAPLSDAEYDRARAHAAAAALENGADRRLPAPVAVRIWSLRHGDAQLLPPTRAELERDRDVATANGRAAWGQMKRHARCAGAHWQAARGAPLTAAWLYWSGRAVDAEGRALRSLRRWREARRMVNYLDGRLAAAPNADEGAGRR